MDTMKTLRQMCDLLGVTRRMVQGYEQEGLVKPSGKNKYGHLLYDESACERIARIRMYQELGFHRKDIARLLDGSRQEAKELLESGILRLEKEQERQRQLLEQVKIFVASIDR